MLSLFDAGTFVEMGAYIRRRGDKENEAYGHQPSPTAVFRGDGKLVRMVSVLSPACFDKPESVRVVKEKDGLYAVSSTGAKEKLDLKKYTF